MPALVAEHALAGYSAAAGGFDEAVYPDGSLRPAWAMLARSLAGAEPGGLAEQQRLADRLVQAEGASYLFHDEGSDPSHPWRLDPLPFVISGAEWATIERGVTQRVRVLERIVDDLYGERRLLRAGAVPAQAAFAAPGHVLAARRAKPPRWLTIIGVDVVRLADGSWSVLRDVTEAPSGLGYALVNRNALAQLLPEQMRAVSPAPLGPFLAATRAALDACAPIDRPSPRTVVLTSGIGHPSYFEHSYLAAHLGYHLAELGDLIVRDERVWLRALGGPELVDVLLRRVDSAHVDPLESVGGELGIPGLARTARFGTVGLANALGAGAASSLTVLPYVDTAARALGEELSLPTLPTVWCGDAAGRAEVAASVADRVVHDVRRSSTVFGWHLGEHDRDALLAQLDLEPSRFVVQARADFATLPVTVDGALVPRTAVLRVTAVAGREGIEVLPGGLARVIDPMVPVVSQTSGVVKDVWVLDDRADQRLPISLRPSRSMPQVDLRESLPTRAAEALYWVGRNAERSESIARTAFVAIGTRNNDPSVAEVAGGAWASAVGNLLRSLGGGDTWDVGAAAPRHEQGADELHQAVAVALLDRSGLVESLGDLIVAASAARQFLSSTTWRLLGELTTGWPERARDGSALRRELDVTITQLSSLAGLFADSTVRGPAWRFLEIGRRVERAGFLLRTLGLVVSPAQPAVRADLYDFVLAANESLVAYRRRYRSDAVLDALVDLLVLDDANPRAFAFQLDELRRLLASLPARAGSSALSGFVEAAASASLELSWLPPGSDQPGADGRREWVDRFVEPAWAALRSFAEHIVLTYFNDPSEVRRVVQRTGG
jgi:uncharacterized circularly permuted ATP-grasp superfamily protein/uncharacterized alpha-E superfamily protein